MADVAHRAGVSHQTVSRVINDVEGIRPATRERVLAAISELGYRRNNAARLLASTRSGLLGVIGWGAGMFGPANLIIGIEESAEARGFRLSVVHVREFTETAMARAVELQLEHAVEALVVVVPHRGALRQLEEQDLGVPVIVAQGDSSQRPLTVATDNAGGARQATRHLLDLGHETVFHLAGPQVWVEAAARREGWEAELREAGRDVPALRWGGDWSARSGYEVGLSIARDPQVTAVFAANDQMALGLMRALREAGRAIPGDVSVVGFDDLPEAAYFTPPLTTVRQEFQDLGRQVMDMVQLALAGEPDPVADPVATQLVVRESTAPPPGGAPVTRL
jgi:DNA-binding LacI/PurR family transcriptional regulator